MTSVLLLGAAGNSGRLIAAELAARGLPIRLAGRRREPLEQVARALAADDVVAVNAAEPDSLAEAVAGAGVVLSTIGPFSRRAAPVIDACLAAGVPYVDIANEWPAVRALLDRDEQARAHGVALVTGAGFGPAATETLVLRLVDRLGGTPDRVRVAAAAGVSRQSDGVRETARELLAQGVAITYRHGQVVREALGSGATFLTFGGAARRMLPGPVGDVETARLASGAADVVAFIADPAERGSGSDSCAWAEVRGAGGDVRTAELHTGEGVQATAAIAAETARRVLAGVGPGAWTAGQLFGAAFVTDAIDARVTVSELRPASAAGSPAPPSRSPG
jgi:saccharopine dehydrogenase (NAD+, L-lysine-forming)